MARRPLVSPTGKPKTIPPVHPNAGVEAAYRRRLLAMVREMQDSLLYWLRAAYRKVEPEPIAQDRDPAVQMRETMNKLARRWRQRLNEVAPRFAAAFVTTAFDHTDRSFAAKLRRAGFTVEFRPSQFVQSAMRAAVAENVGLIKSIGEQHLTQVQGDVMRAVMAGRDLGMLTNQLETRYGVSARRASFIARDQANKMTAVATKARREELGLTEAIWVHSGGGKHPRAEHVKAGRDKLRFDVRRGAFIDGQWIQPGELPNCFPADALVDIRNGCHKVWRYHYRGHVVVLKAGKAVIRSTPNHPFLTNKGWVPAQLIKKGDHVWKARREEFNSGVSDHHIAQAAIADVFEAFRTFGTSSRHCATGFDFHGDIPDSDVETVWLEFGLSDERDAELCQRVDDFLLARANRRRLVEGDVFPQVRHPAQSGAFGNVGSVRFGEPGKPKSVGFRATTRLHPVGLKARHHENSITSDCARNRENAFACLELADDFCIDLGVIQAPRGNAVFGKHAPDDSVRYTEVTPYFASSQPGIVEFARLHYVNIETTAGLPTLSGVGGVPVSAEVLAEFIRVYAEICGSGLYCDELFMEPCRVVHEITSEDFAGHVFTLETTAGYYHTSTENVVTKNCRCVSSVVVPGFD